ncbi:MAG TPA: outer membrane beta-barrel protein [Cyclobacteriaceae bacterium]
MKIRIVLYVVALMFAGAAQAQSSVSEGEKPRKLLYYFNGGVGVYIPTSTHGALSETGFASSFQFQVDYKKHFFGRVFFDQYNVSFHTRYTAQDGSNLFINGKVASSMIGMEPGYRWHLKRFSPYIYTGLGIAITDLPYLKNTETSKDVELTTNSQSALAFRGGVGITYKISKMFILYMESQYLSFPITTQVYDGSLNGVSIQIGFKTPLQ